MELDDLNISNLITLKEYMGSIINNQIYQIESDKKRLIRKRNINSKHVNEVKTKEKIIRENKNMHENICTILNKKMNLLGINIRYFNNMEIL